MEQWFCEKAIPPSSEADATRARYQRLGRWATKFESFGTRRCSKLLLTTSRAPSCPVPDLRSPRRVATGPSGSQDGGGRSV